MTSDYLIVEMSPAYQTVSYIDIPTFCLKNNCGFVCLVVFLYCWNVLNRGPYAAVAGHGTRPKRDNTAMSCIVDKGHNSVALPYPEGGDAEGGSWY